MTTVPQIAERTQRARDLMARSRAEGRRRRVAKSELLDLPTRSRVPRRLPAKLRITRELPLESEGIRERHRHIPGPSTTRPSTHCRRRRWSGRGSIPGLLDEVIWWRTDDLWFWALEALVIYVRPCSRRSRQDRFRHRRPDREPSRRAARSHDLTSPPRSLVRGRTEHAAGRWMTHAEAAIWRSSSVGLGAPEFGVLRSSAAPHHASLS
jgi:hypothetical protein